MEPIRYEPASQDVRFSPTEQVDRIPGMDREYERQNRGDIAALNQLKANNKVKVDNAGAMGKELVELSKYSETLMKTLVEKQERVNKEQMVAGINDSYLNGTDTTTLKEGEQALLDTDAVTSEAAGEFEAEGGDVFTGERIRQSSGWYAYGQRVGQIQQAAAAFPAFVAQAATDVSVTITDEDGNERAVTLNTSGLEPAEYQAVMAEIRSQFFSQFAGTNPAILAEYLFPEVQKFETQQFRQWYQTREAEIKDNRQIEILSGFANGLTDINKTYQDLLNAGVSPAEAKRELFKTAFEAFKGGVITEEQYNAIRNTPYPPGGTWESANRSLLLTVEQDIAQENIQDTNRQVAQANANATKDVLAMVAELDPNLTNEQVDELIDRAMANHPLADASVFNPLTNYRDNITLQSRDEKDQVETLNNMYATGQLSVRELQSGKYSPDVITQFMGKAQQMDQLRGQTGERQGASTNQSKAVKNTILSAVGVTSVDSLEDGSALFAIDAALASVDNLALSIKTADPNKSWAQAYQEASMAVVQEIRSAQDQDGDPTTFDPNKNSPYYVNNEDRKGSPFFPAFRPEGARETRAQAESRRELTTTLIRERGRDAFGDDGGIFRAEDAKNLSNPNNPIDPKLRGAVRTYNELNPDDQITLEEARGMVVENFGLKLERPYERDAYEEVAVSGKILDILNNPTGANVARVSAQGGLPTLTIRDGHQGGHDIVRASIAIGVPPQIAPLAAVVFANETGWGKYTSGQNNLFNIKSTDGTGTTTMTREGDINVDGGVATEATWRDYGSRAESLRDFWSFLQTNPRYAAVLTASTPMEALQELHAAGYATSGTYVQDVGRLFEDLGIDGNVPYQPQQLTDTPWGNTANMSPLAAVYITDNIGPTSTGQHLDVKRVDGGFFNYTDLDGFVEVDDPEMGRVALGSVPETGDFESHTSRGSHGRDYGTYSGTPVYLTNGARVVSSQRTVHGDLLIVELPNGIQYSFLHGKTA